MSDARQRAEWGRGASFASLVVQAVTGERIDPMKLIPPRYRPDDPPPVKRSAEAERRAAELILSRL